MKSFWWFLIINRNKINPKDKIEKVSSLSMVGWFDQVTHPFGISCGRLDRTLLLLWTSSIISWYYCKAYKRIGTSLKAVCYRDIREANEFDRADSALLIQTGQEIMSKVS